MDTCGVNKIEKVLTTIRFGVFNSTGWRIKFATGLNIRMGIILAKGQLDHSCTF